MGEKIMVYPWKWKLLGNKKSQTMDTRSDIDKSQNNYAEWKRNIYCHSYKILENAN